MSNYFANNYCCTKLQVFTFNCCIILLYHYSQLSMPTMCLGHADETRYWAKQSLYINCEFQIKIVRYTRTTKEE